MAWPRELHPGSRDIASTPPPEAVRRSARWPTPSRRRTTRCDDRSCRRAPCRRLPAALVPLLRVDVLHLLPAGSSCSRSGSSSGGEVPALLYAMSTEPWKAAAAIASKGCRLTFVRRHPATKEPVEFVGPGSPVLGRCRRRRSSPSACSRRGEPMPLTFRTGDHGDPDRPAAGWSICSRFTAVLPSRRRRSWFR